MRSLSDTLARLRAMRTRPEAPAQPVIDRLSDLDGFGSNPGALRARIYVPERLAPDAALVVVLHGCTQSAAAYDHGAGWSRLADRDGFALVFPEQQRANNANLCFNWFQVADAGRDRGEALSIRQMIEAMIANHAVDRRRVFVTGLSAGGAMAATMLATYPETFSGGAIIAGLAHGSARTVPEAFDRMRGHGGPTEDALQAALRDASAHAGTWPTLSIWHGNADTTVVPSNARAIVAQWRGVHGLQPTPTRTETVAGHRREVWCDRGGREVIELFTIAGMGHGTPLDTRGDGAIGAPGPYMLDAGISSTIHVPRFWGLAAGEARAREPDAEAASATPPRPLDGEIILPGDAPRQRDESRGPRRGPASATTGVGKVIEDALRAAGLMR